MSLDNLLDNFNRADENPLSGGGNWSISGTFVAPFQLFSNGILATSGAKINQSSFVNVGDLTNVDVAATISVLPGTGNYIGVIARQDPTVNTGKNCYDCIYIPGTGVLVDYYDSLGTSHNLATYSVTLNAGDAIGLSINGTTLRAYYKPSGGSWTQLGSITDTRFSHGYIGVAGFPLISGGKLDDFSGGVYSILPTTDAATISSKTTVSGTDVAAYTEPTTIKSTTKVISGTIEVINVHAFDYNWNSWDTSYLSDSTSTFGSVGFNDNDSGIITLNPLPE